MAQLQDGLGGEEVQISGEVTLYEGGGYISPYWIGSITSESNISGLNIYAGGSLFGNVVNSPNGAMFTASLNGAYGAKVQAGSCITTSAGLGSAIFPVNFANTHYAINCMMGSAIIANLGSTYGISGLKSISGCTFWGPASMPTDWIAVGI